MYRYLRSNDGLGVEPQAHFVVPTSRQPLYKLGLSVDEVAPKHTTLLLCQGAIMVVDKVGTPAVAVGHPACIHNKAMAPTEEQHAVGETTAIPSHPSHLLECR